jgi:predicted transposase YdaD
MLQVHDIRESRVYQEARQEGKEEGLALAIARMAANKMTIEQIAAILELDVERVRQVLVTAGQN